MVLFTIDTKKCKHDGICVEECPMRILEMKDASSAPKYKYHRLPSRKEADITWLD